VGTGEEWKDRLREQGWKECRRRKEHLSALPTNAACQLDVFGHDGDTLGVNGTQIGVLKQANQIGLTGLLQSPNGCTLETQISLEVLGDFSHQALEGQLADQQLSRLLVTTDLTQSHGTRPVSMGLLDPTSGRGTLAGSLCRQLLTWGFASS